MSSIIKSGRVREQGIINLSERASHKIVVEEVYEDVTSIEEYEHETSPHVTSVTVEQKREELEVLENQINQRLQEANKAAEEILAKARDKAREIEANAKIEQGIILAEAQQKQEQVLQSAEKEVMQIKDSALLEKQEMLNEVEGEVVETMITLLKHIISEELSYNNRWLTYVVHQMLKNQKIDDEITLIVSTKQYEILNEQKDELFSKLPKLSLLKEDSTLNDTTCVITTSEGNIEYDVTNGLEKVITELRILKGLS